MKHPIATLFAAAALALTGAAASAQQYASTSKQVHLRAGPGRDYPVVAILPPQMQVAVFGCITSYTWCDVGVGPDRGWVYAGNLVYFQDNRQVLLPSIAPIIGIGIAAFIIDDYWRDHYIDRPWWPQRRRWYRPAPQPQVIHRPGSHQPYVQPPHNQPVPRAHPQPQTRILPQPGNLPQPPHVQPGQLHRQGAPAQPGRAQPQRQQPRPGAPQRDGR